MEFAERTCGLPIETLKKVAHMIAEAEGVCVLWAMGITQHSMGSDSSTAISNLLFSHRKLHADGYRCLPLAGTQQCPGSK